MIFIPLNKLFSLLLFSFLIQFSILEAQIFAEKNGLVKIEMESIPMKESWKLDNKVSGFTGSGYIYWTGAQYLNNTSHGILDYKIFISNPGTYKLKWYTRVGSGTDNTLHNDTWLKIDGARDFYAKDATHVVHPKGVCTNDCPNSQGGNGFFKFFQAKWDQWRWMGATWDDVAMDVYADFDEPGIYTIKLAARSSYHFIDKMVLFNVGMMTQATATNSSTPFSPLYPFSKPENEVILKNSELLIDFTNVHGSIDCITVSSNSPKCKNLKY